MKICLKLKQTWTKTGLELHGRWTIELDQKWIKLEENNTKSGQE